METWTEAIPDGSAAATPPEAANFEVSRLKMLLLLIGIFALLALGVFSLLKEGATFKGQFWGGVLVVFFGLALRDFISDLFIAGPVLSIDREGIWDKRFSTARIPWREIEKVTLRKYKMNKMIGISVTEPERYLKSIFSLRGLFARLNPILRFPKLTLPTVSLTGSAEEIAAAVEHFRAQASEDDSSSGR